MIPADTREINVSDTVQLLHKFITTPIINPAYFILHGLNTLSGAIKDVPTATYEAQIKDIKQILRYICTGWAGIDALAHPKHPKQPPRKSQVHELTSHPRISARVEEFQQPQKAQQPPRVPENNNLPKPTPRVHVQDQVPAPAPGVNPKKEPKQEPVGPHTRSQSQPA